MPPKYAIFSTVLFKIVDLNCHFYVVEATFESKWMYFQDYDYAVRKGAKNKMTKDVSSVSLKRCHPHRPRKSNKSDRTKQQEETENIRRPVWLVKWKEVNRILEEYIFIYGYVFLLSSSFNINGIAGSFFVKKYGLHNWQPFSVTYLIFCVAFWSSLAYH